MLSLPPAVSPRTALQATVQVRRETTCSASSCATWKMSGKYVPPNPKAYFCNPKVCFCLGEVLKNRASQSLVSFEKQKINKRREGLPKDYSEGSSYGNNWLVSASLVPCILSDSREAPSGLLSQHTFGRNFKCLCKMNQSFVLNLQRS